MLYPIELCVRSRAKKVTGRTRTAQVLFNGTRCNRWSSSTLRIVSHSMKSNCGYFGLRRFVAPGGGADLTTGLVFVLGGVEPAERLADADRDSRGAVRS